MTNDVYKELSELSEIGGDIRDTLDGGLSYDTMTYRGNLLNRLYEIASGLKGEVLCEKERDDYIRQQFCKLLEIPPHSSWEAAYEEIKLLKRKL